MAYAWAKSPKLWQHGLLERPRFSPLWPNSFSLTLQFARNAQPRRGDLTICHSYGGCLSVCQLYRANYKITRENSNQTNILPFSLTCHAISARQRRS